MGKRNEPMKKGEDSTKEKDKQRQGLFKRFLERLAKEHQRSGGRICTL